MTTTVSYMWADEPSAKLRAEFERAVDAWESVIDVRFVEDATAPDLTIHLTDVYGPGAADILGPGMWIDPTLEQRWGAWEHDTYGRLVVTHELGHTLGLPHPHDYGSDATMLTSIMSYSYVTSSNGSTLFPDEPGLLDIAMLGEVYGYNPATASDGTTHRIPSGRDHGIDTVFDLSGDRDVIDLSGLAVGCVVDLGSGLVDLGGNGYAVLGGIEGVWLGKGADTVILSAGDLVYGLTRDDVLIGDGDVHKLTRGEKRELGVSGRWFEADGAYVEWGGKLTKLAAMIVEDVG